MNIATITTISGVKVQCTFSPVNLHIKDSYLIKDRKIMMEIITKARRHALSNYGYNYTRSEKQWLCEWRAHNLLYRLDYQPERTGSVDLDEAETDRRNVLYRILSFLYNFIH